MITGMQYLDAVRDAHTLLCAHQNKLNAMNVFPVPDGDTGTNMLRTLSGVLELTASSSDALSDVSDRVASAMLEKARGNSGIMLSLLFRGISVCFQKAVMAGGEMLAQALSAAADCAWNAVPDPQEGTILTVARYAADAAQAVPKKTVQTVITAACAGALQGLQKTTAMLPQLQKAQVVDAGGYGYLLVLHAFARRFGGTYTVQTFSEAVDMGQTVPGYKYCTELWIRQKQPTAGTAELQNFLSHCGDCGTAVSQQGRIKVHVHTDAPWRVLEKALEYGNVYDIKIDDMAEQVGQRG